MKQMLKDESYLLEKFKNESQKSEVYKDYVIQYSERNKDELLPEESKDRGDIDMIFRYLEADSTFKNYYKRILEFKDPMIFETKINESRYSNKQLKYIGIECMHDLGANNQY